MFTSTNSAYTKSVRRTAHRAFSLKNNSSKIGDDRGGDRLHMISQKYIAMWLEGRIPELNVNDQSFDPVEEALAVTFYIICEAAFGYEATYEEFRVFTDNLDLAFHEFAYKQSTNPLRKIFWPFLPGAWKARRATRSVRKFAEQVIDALQSTSITSKEYSSNDHEEESHFLSLLLKNPDVQHNKSQQVSEIVMFMAAGHETTGAMISNVMILLAKHQDIQDKLRKSLLENKDNVHETPYFKWVLLEANRIFPVAVMGSTRLTGRSFVLEDGFVIPPDSICFLPQYLYFQDSDTFKDPHVFEPDRWKESSEPMKDAASVTFSLGPRSCPGRNLAMEEINRLLPQMLLRYSLHQVSKSKPDYQVILKHSNARLKVKELAEARASCSSQKTKEVISRFSYKYRPAVSRPTATGLVQRNWTLFCSILSLLVGIFAFQYVHTVQNCPPTSIEWNASSSLKIAILTEPSPIGSYICGQSKRIEFLMQYLVENTNDTVTLITAEVHDELRPSTWRDIAVHYTYGMRLPSYSQISISLDWTGKAFRELYNFRPDLIHVTTPGPLLFPSVAASRILGIPLVMSCHTHLTAYSHTYLPPGPNVIAEWLLWRYTAAVHSFAHLTLVTSPQIQEDFQEHGISRVEVWQKGVNSEQFHPDHYNAGMRYQMTGGHPDNFLLVYVGRLAEEKRLVVLKGVLERVTNATLCFVGAGPYENQLRKFFEGTNAVFLGELKGLALSQAFASGDVFCMPSTSETLGFVVLESMASGVPVIAANAGGLQHLIEHERTGFLVTPDSEEGFVETAQELQDSPLLRKRIISAARHETELWTWESSMEQLRNDIYPRAMKNHQEHLGTDRCGKNLS
eukprot:scaffold11109_cov138-Amphora_coffeaeformis.AAC.2